MDNNLYEMENKNKIEENEELIKHNEEIKVGVIKSIKFTYLFSHILIIVPLFFLAFPCSEEILVFSNLLKIPLLVIFCFFVLKIIKMCNMILKYDLSAESKAVK